MKRMLGFLPSAHSGGGEEVEEAADIGGLSMWYIMRMSRTGVGNGFEGTLSEHEYLRKERERGSYNDQRQLEGR